MERGLIVSGEGTRGSTPISLVLIGISLLLSSLSGLLLLEAEVLAGEVEDLDPAELGVVRVEGLGPEEEHGDAEVFLADVERVLGLGRVLGILRVLRILGVLRIFGTLGVLGILGVALVLVLVLFVL